MLCRSLLAKTSSWTARLGFIIVCRGASGRAFLCGEDPVTGRDLSHRKEWIRDRLKLLTDCFAIEPLRLTRCCRIIVHLILRTRPDLVATWSDEEVARRWWRMFPKRRKKDGTAAEPKRTELDVLMADADAVRREAATAFQYLLVHGTSVRMGGSPGEQGGSLQGPVLGGPLQMPGVGRRGCRADVQYVRRSQPDSGENRRNAGGKRVYVGEGPHRRAEDPQANVAQQKAARQAT